MKDPEDAFGDAFKIEEILSVSEQVSNVRAHKNQSPEEKLFKIVTRIWNPFESANFNGS